LTSCSELAVGAASVPLGPELEALVLWQRTRLAYESPATDPWPSAFLREKRVTSHEH
jgi:hypothetical protein